MAARDRVKTMASRTCSTLYGHPEVEERATQVFFSLLANTKLQVTFLGLVKFSLPEMQ